MNNGKNYPWNTRTDDFSVPGLHSKPSESYSVMLRALRLSPSYELAYAVRSGQITKEEEKKLPKDFDQVLATYDLIGNVDFMIFRLWWLKHGIAIFGNPHTKPEIRVIDIFSQKQEINFEEVNKKVKRNLKQERDFEGLPPTLLLTIPLNLKKTEIIKKLKFILNETTKELPEQPAEPLIKLMNKRLNKHAMAKGLSLFLHKCADPDQELWRLGAKAKISATYSPRLNYLAPRKPKDALEMNDRIILSKITHRTLKRFELIIENAARGRFPCDEQVECAIFDYPRIIVKERALMKWEREFKDRWKQEKGLS